MPSPALPRDERKADQGEAFSQALAYLLGLPAIDVKPSQQVGPNSLLELGRELCAAHGVGLIVLPVALPLPALLNSIETLNPGQPFLLAGTSCPGGGHVVACDAGRIVCDLDGRGIAGPCPDGNYWLAYVVAPPRRVRSNLH